MAENSNGSSKTAGVIIILALVLVVLAGGYYLFMYKPQQEAKEKARLEQIAKEEAEKKRQELEAQKKVKYEELIKNADVAFAEENWETAHSLYAEAASLLPDQQYAKDQLALVRAKLDELAAKQTPGTIETVASPTGRFYVVVSSSVDGDLAMDYANKLAKEGNSLKIINPSGTNKLFHRVSVGDYPTWDEAVAATSSASAFGEGVWVLKY
ncbi:SPOR domain-containing protein [Imperialibacter roseus]|uniref:SPOR domain-containing protein n=1 Tax=Imperialibacter roseus TaxID=1324217 RepID=A0ABZ0IVS2_9BACT|nr:SPOR domain-containing protein [Imperialibacter roseus]WOK09153.1 SPOR domain-containing protein [Imperialibacter roseus]|tara:strand:- start:63898 stop:64530 length:633 start_codon:yes stop_codon:yes gene_type:complete